MKDKKKKLADLMRVNLSALKSDPVLVAAWILALASAFLVHPNASYLSYIDFRSLGILWGLMVIIQGFRENTVFEKIGAGLLQKVKKEWQLGAVLVFLCFITSMFITNDVALITFVPFAIMILKNCQKEERMIPVIVLQTIAANLGSMLTPIGNPQNLYLYGVTGMSIQAFLGTMFPYSLLAAILLGLAVLKITDRKQTLTTKTETEIVKHFGSRIQIGIYGVLFALALATVLRILPWYAFALLVLIVVGGMDFKILFRADYILLLTFIGFFIFTGNMGQIQTIRQFLASAMEGRTFIIAVLTSQLISNVPATLMLADFTEDMKGLLLGVNVGGLGTLIASMASLISYKAYTKEAKAKSGEYLKSFTAWNVAFLLVMLGFYFLRG